ncbi:solute carrier organic anion transporter family member 74D-like [Oppia nitens]|uniref:solute carrier organic anion transporter family member 74D-like n=1 Tax=Oppia nitens TaxID=1686743 RepID=UPI0023D983B5|nr:solute carrier organic anion transporter family member 74D-like [Oppia nitens]
MAIYASCDSIADRMGCGIGRWRPKSIQRLMTPTVFIILFSLLGILQCSPYNYVISSLTTLERRYAISSVVMGIVFIGDDVAEVLFNPFLGYFAHQMHKPRIIAYSMLISAAGCFIGALPYFIYGSGIQTQQVDTTGAIVNQTVQSNHEFCDISLYSASDCDKNIVDYTKSLVPVLCLFCCTFLVGLGIVTYYIIGVPYVDDIVNKRQSPMYFGLLQCVRLLGPAGAQLLSSLVLRVYENPFVDSGIRDLTDPRWVGAWWLGLIILGILLALSSIPMFLFPPHISTKNLVTRCKRMLTNPIFMLVLIGDGLRLFAINGYNTFKGKYIETMYKKSASMANLITGSIGYLAAMFLDCPKTYYSSLPTYDNLGGCKSNCSCQSMSFHPICGADNFTHYYSPCFAGCTTNSLIKSDNGSDLYAECECFDNQVATDGYCDPNCGNNFEILIIIITVAGIVGSTSRIGSRFIGFRIVDDIDKSFSLAFVCTVLAIFVHIPYPIVYGAIVNSACMVWETKCGQTGNCQIYDSEKLKNRLLGTTVSLIVIGFIFDLIVVILSSRIKHLYDEEDEEEDGKR